MEALSMPHCVDNTTQIVTISFCSIGWMQNLITTCWKVLPGKTILVVDNNPDEGEEGYETNHAHDRFKYGSIVDAERKWLNLHKNKLIVIKPTNRQNLTHGGGMDLAKEWCLEHGMDNLTHVEPDCLFSSNKWYLEQIKAIGQGMVVAGCIRTAWYSKIGETSDSERAQIRARSPIHPACATYHLPPIAELSFKVQTRAHDMHEDAYKDIITPCYDCVNAQNRPDWDTAHKIWYEVAKINKYKHTDRHDLIHTWQSTTVDYWTRKRIKNYSLVK